MTLDDAERLIDQVVYISEIDASFERVRAITDFRRDETEARVLYICRRSGSDDLYILKCKVQYGYLPLASLASTMSNCGIKEHHRSSLAVLSRPYPDRVNTLLTN